MSAQFKAAKTKDLRFVIVEMKEPLSRARNLTIALALASVSDAPLSEECKRNALTELGIMAHDAAAQCEALWEELFEISHGDQARRTAEITTIEKSELQ